METLPPCRRTIVQASAIALSAALLMAFAFVKRASKTRSGRITTLRDFQNAVNDAHAVQKRITRACLLSSLDDAESLNLSKALNDILETLLAIPTDHSTGKRVLEVGDGVKKASFFQYTFEEVSRDDIFLSMGEEELIGHLRMYHETNHPDERPFSLQVSQTVDALKAFLGSNSKSDHHSRERYPRFSTWITDRDGTVCNYCDTYSTAVQSSYNSVFLCKFAANAVEHGRSVFITSAPLSGLRTVSTNPLDVIPMVYAGSKGREFVDPSSPTHVRRSPITVEDQRILDSLNEKLKGKLSQEPYSQFSFIGSGFQEKFGQSTIARQDNVGSIPASTSNEWLDVICELVRSIDPKGEHLVVEDTGLDVEIILTIKDASSSAHMVHEFDKGDGLSFVNDQVGLGLEKTGPHLVSGDTRSDIPMLKELVRLRPGMVACVFVTTDERLKEEVREVLPESLFVSSPDVFVTALHEMSKLNYV